MDLPASTCKNCASPVPETVQFCPNCGQQTHVHRLDMNHIMHDLIHVFTHADKGIFFLTKELIRRPGLVAREYVAGARKKYFNPFNYLVLTIAVSAFLTNYFHLLDIDLKHTNPANALVTKHINLIFLLGVPVAAFFSWLLFKRSGYNYAENLAQHAFMGGFRVFFFILIFTPLVIFYRQYYFSALSAYLVAWVAFLSWSNIQFYGGKKLVVILKTVLSIVLTQFVMSTLIIIAIRFFHH